MHYGYLLFLFCIICYVNALPEFYQDRRDLKEAPLAEIKHGYRVKRFFRMTKESDEEVALTKEESSDKQEEEALPVSEEEIDEQEEEILGDDQSDQQQLQRRKRYLKLKEII